jgi:YhcN/YlaJ family sporulation lipoprotein
MLRIKLTQAIICGFMIFLLSACNYQKQFESSESDYGTRNVGDEDTTIISRPQVQANQKGGGHFNTKLAYSQPASDLISSQRGIRDSIVVVSHSNAYVALLLDQSATGMKGKGTELPSDNRIGSNQFHERGEGRLRPPEAIWTEKYSFDAIPDDADLSSELKALVTAKVRAAFPDVANVYVSANPQFLNEMSHYAHEAWRGHSLEPYLQHNNSMVIQVFS